MTTLDPPDTAADADPPANPVGRMRPPWAMVAAALVGGLTLGWQGGWLGAVGTAGVMTVGLGLPWLRREGARSGVLADDFDPQRLPRVSGGRVGAEVMVSQVLPVWGKQLDITREAAAEGLDKLLNGFAQVSGALGSLSDNLEHFTPSVEAGAVDGVLGGASPALAALLAPSQRAFAQRDAVVAELTHCAQALDALRQAGQDAREIGKHTRLVAFNASIEAQRNNTGGANGAVAVALETRALAERMAEVGARIGSTVNRLTQTLGPRQLHAEIDDTSDDELQMELALRAREALNGLLGSMGSALQGSAEIKQASQALRSQVDELFVNFQFGDRLAQMLNIVGTDMDNFARWVGAHPNATQSDAADWLAKLAASYTMEEQRSRHHGNVHIDRGSEIEFF